MKQYLQRLIAGETLSRQDTHNILVGVTHQAYPPEQIAALQQEIATLRQNAENTARAPVSASAGSPENAPEDQFMQGFNSY